MKSLLRRIGRLEQVLKEKTDSLSSAIGECICYDTHQFNLFDNPPTIYPARCHKCGLFRLTISINYADGFLLARATSPDLPYKIVRDIGGLHSTAGGFQLITQENQKDNGVSFTVQAPCNQNLSSLECETSISLL